MDSDEEDYVFFGTPIEREEEITSRRKKSQAEASGHLRTLVPWKQEVRDEEGRRRFHGAFTGGFSAGYYNTAGSKEGWTPQTFTSSRKNRAEVKQQSILNFLDDDERAELEGKSLGTSSQFDTFGFTAAEFARKQAEKEQLQRPSAIPGPVPDELVVPATESIGVKLLLKMGWRRGRSIKDSHADSLYDARREARKALLAFSCDDAKTHFPDSEPVESSRESFLEHPVNDDVQSSQSTPVYVLNPKQDLHGLGYDPFKHAPEFREKKRSRLSKEPGYRKTSLMKDSLFGFKCKAAPGFGIGALEEYDAEDEDVYTSDYNFEDTYVQEDEEPSEPSKDSRKKLVGRDQDVLPGFTVASKSDFKLERFDSPVVPKDFVPHHKFSGPLETDSQLLVPPPPEVPPPEDNNLKLLIEGVATLVARCGKLFEDLSREKNQSNPLFSFLDGGKGHEYYVRKLWEMQQKHSDQTKLDGKSSPSVQKMTAESRGKLLGERPLEQSSRDSNLSTVSENVVHLQFNLSDTFTASSSFSELPEVAKPFKDDPAKQARFGQFLKEKYQGGLRTTDSGGATNMSEAARARERLDFEAVAEAMQKGKSGKESLLTTQQFVGFSAAGGLQFTSVGTEQIKDAQAEDLTTKKMYPRREEFQWRPSPILCKRFDLVDPFMGKPPPAPRMRSKIDSLIFMSDSIEPTKSEQSVKNLYSAPQSEAPEVRRDVTDKETEVEVEVENVERPVDLYKAIFSDESEDEVETVNLNKVEDPEKKIEVANTALNHLIAGDFLESLGKELGLEVPPELPYSTSKASTRASEKEAADANAGKARILPAEKKPSTSNVSGGTTIDQGLSQQRGSAQEGESRKNESTPGNPLNSGGRIADTETVLHEYKPSKVNREKTKENAKAKSPSRHHRNWSSNSEDERSRKRYRQHQYRSSDSYSDSSTDHRDRHHSRSRRQKKESSREKTSSRRKHHKHRGRDSPRRSRYSTEKEDYEEKKEKRKWRD
ncbi:G patch domain-containing protein TGH isoform X2 [Mangifera indica]|uniref:G patch domain-containing protein TGH isoform X2 n=1 Tax=Mangifera indica TaxID=29780 RepID=UPI001CF98DBA|nr:G patch domain-containing protein TGH isoform X2 [Mangifera indica]